ncbi:hypothetical protein CKO28_06065 [Rhodovibrio sodomensis]|uniref:Uncharacterized protein n=2 Tax=Rhodovibrio sodomensis TaxID=1088 RepID=A0ABS1DCD3_9PROT|nr:hypothetical protein [Rhodovibrio sodomensis]
MQDRIQEIKRALDSLPDVSAMSPEQQKEFVDALFAKLGIAALTATGSPTLVSSAFFRHAVMSYGYTNADDDDDISLVGMGGVMSILAANTPPEPEVSLQEAARIMVPFQRRIDTYAEALDREAGGRDDFESIFGYASVMKTGALDLEIDALLDEQPAHQVGATLISRGQSLITEALGHHRAAQYLTRCAAFHVHHAVDPEAAARQDAYQRELAEIDLEAEAESEAEAAADGDHEARLRKRLREIIEGGGATFTEPFDSDAAGLTPEPVCDVSAYSLYELCEDGAELSGLADYLDARWYGVFRSAGWSVNALLSEGDPRLPSFHLNDPQLGEVDVFTVEDGDPASVHPDSDVAISSWGARHRMMSKNAILILGAQARPEIVSEDEPGYLTLGWYLPALTASEQDRDAAEQTRSWSLAMIESSEWCKPRLATVPVDEQDQPLSPVTCDPDYLEDFVFNEEEAGLDAEECGFDRVFMRRILWGLRTQSPEAA